MGAGTATEAPVGGAADDIPTYRDLSYRDVFWPPRRYEDACDRVALHAFLPPTGIRILDIGAGFGRLADEYDGYTKVCLLDPSDTLLAAARERLGADPRFTFVQGDARALPFADGTFDAVVMVRVLLHVADPAPVLTEIARVLRPGGVAVVEHPNRRHWLSIARWALRRQSWSPFGPTPHEYLPMHFAHQPRTIVVAAEAAGLRAVRRRTVSLFRHEAISRRVPTRYLVALERPLQVLLSPLLPGPSVYLKLRRSRPAGRVP